MSTTSELNEPLLKVIHNGIDKVIPFSLAQQLLRQCSIGWVIPTHCICYQLRGQYERRLLTTRDRAGMQFGRLLLSRRRGLLLTIEDMVDEDGISPGKNAFGARARRFIEALIGKGSRDNTLTPEQRPFESVALPLDKHRYLPAYRMKESINWLVVREPEHGEVNAVDWDLLMTPPLAPNKTEHRDGLAA